LCGTGIGWSYPRYSGADSDRSRAAEDLASAKNDEAKKAAQEKLLAAGWNYNVALAVLFTTVVGLTGFLIFIGVTDVMDEWVTFPCNCRVFSWRKCEKSGILTV